MSGAFAGLDRALARHLPGFLARQRWFAGKGRDLDSIALEETAELPGAGSPCAYVVVRVGYAGGLEERYALLLAVLNGADPALRIAAGADWDGPADLVEAATLPAPGRALLAGFIRPDTRIASSGGGALAYGDTRGHSPFGDHTAENLPVKPLGAEQSNTSLRAGDHVFKLFRRIENGESPEVEIGRFFAERTRFTALPQLGGSLSLAHGDTVRTAGVLQQFVPHRADGWRWMLEQLAARREGRVDDAALAVEARRIGVLTADMHLALGSRDDVPGFAPRPVSAEDVQSWRASFEARLARLSDDLRRHLATVPPPAVADAAAVLERAADLPALAPSPHEAAGAGVTLIRLHGDYHLGQTLRTDDGYVVMDFEGEPSRPLAERRDHGCALRDVAGMLRSFDYAEATAGTAAGAASGHTPLRETFLAAYLGRVVAGGARFIPAGAATARRWAAFFELDKALYEIEYELHHRPGWIWIPLRGARQLAEAGHHY